MDDSIMIELLTKGMDTIMVPASYKGTEFQIPACRRNPGEHYRISHSTLLFFYRRMKRTYKDVQVQMRSEWNHISVGYCIAACNVVTKEGVSDLYFGENRVTTFSSRADADNPFQIAVNRAMDKAIFYEIFGLPSRYFSPDGMPVLSYDEDMTLSQGDADIEQSENTGGQNQAPQPTVKESSSQMSRQDPAGLNSIEEEEMSQLGKVKVPVYKDGIKKEMPLSNMSDKLLAYFSQNIQSEKDAGLKKQIERLIALRAKKAMQKTA